jgi:hypothetical protein
MGLTSEEIKELNINEEIFEQWKSIMNAIWLFCNVSHQSTTYQRDNEIFCKEYKICATMVNASIKSTNGFVAVIVEKDGIELLSIRYLGDKTKILSYIELAIK